MPSPNTITANKLNRLIGTQNAPVLIDVRIDEDFEADPRLIPTSHRHSHRDITEWAPAFAGQAVGDRFDAALFDMEDVFWSHRGERCTFDIMVEEFGLTSPALSHIRGADTARLDLAPEAPGLLAAPLRLSHTYADDLERLDASMSLYDGLYRWRGDVQNEGHDWPPRKAKA